MAARSSKHSTKRESSSYSSYIRFDWLFCSGRDLRAPYLFAQGVRVLAIDFHGTGRRGHLRLSQDEIRYPAIGAWDGQSSFLRSFMMDQLSKRLGVVKHSLQKYLCCYDSLIMYLAKPDFMTSFNGIQAIIHLFVGVFCRQCSAIGQVAWTFMQYRSTPYDKHIMVGKNAMVAMSYRESHIATNAYHDVILSLLSRSLSRARDDDHGAATSLSFTLTAGQRDEGL